MPISVLGTETKIKYSDETVRIFQDEKSEMNSL